jgi:hypothetical protein
MTFDDIWPYTDDIPGSFTRLSGEKYYEQALQSRTIVEVGVDQGRSASLLLFAARETRAHVILVDSWPGIMIDNLVKVRNRLAADFSDVFVDVLHMPSAHAGHWIRETLDMVHIDAHHGDGAGNCDTGSGPWIDCQVWLPKLNHGGVACFHDYDATFPAVTDAVNVYTEGWEHLGNWDGLAIRRKP